jgi:hypothetical protein
LHEIYFLSSFLFLSVARRVERSLFGSSAKPGVGCCLAAVADGECQLCVESRLAGVWMETRRCFSVCAEQHRLCGDVCAAVCADKDDDA